MASLSASKTQVHQPILSMRRRENLAFLAFVMPNLIGVLLFTAIPVIVGFGLSFTDWNMLSDPKWVGIQNYRDLMNDDLFWISLKNTLYYSLMVIPGNMVISLGLALALTSGLKGSRIYRTIFFLPYISSVVAVALVWKWIMNPSFGVANSILDFFGLHGSGWFTDPGTALISVAIVAIWQTAGDIKNIARHEQEVWTGVGYLCAASMYHWGRRVNDGALQAGALMLAWGVHQQTWHNRSTGYWFNTPEAWDIDNPTHGRAPMYQRPRGIWELLMEVHDPFALES